MIGKNKIIIVVYLGISVTRKNAINDKLTANSISDFTKNFFIILTKPNPI